MGSKRKNVRPSYRPFAVGQFRLGWLVDQFCVSWTEGGERKRYRLGVATEEEARTELAAFAREHVAVSTGADRVTIAALYEQYIADREREGKQVYRMCSIWNALKDDFAHMPPDSITKKDCRAYWAKRESLGKKPHTIHGELRFLKTVLNWGASERLSQPVISFWIPPMPEPRDRHLTREEVSRLMQAAEFPHVKLFLTLALATAARKTALLELAWTRVDFERGLIYLQDPHRQRTSKGRAVAPMNKSARAALLEAREGAVSEYVIEWNGKRVADIKKAVSGAFERSGLKIKGDGAHTLRHTAAVWMAEERVPMAEIAQYLGHTDVRTTYRIYARFSPDYLQKAASAVELPPVQLVANDRRSG